MAYTYSKIATYTVGSGGIPSVAFLNIPQTYTDLILKMSVRTDSSARYGVGFIRPNASTTNLSGRVLEGIGSAANSYTEVVWRFEPDGGIATASTFGNAEVYIPNYTSSNYKSASADTVSENNQIAADMYLKAWLWSNTAPITSLDIVANTGQTFDQHSTFHLYGIKAEV